MLVGKYTAYGTEWTCEHGFVGTTQARVIEGCRYCAAGEARVNREKVEKAVDDAWEKTAG